MRKIVFDFKGINSEIESVNKNINKREKSNDEDMFEYIDEAMKSENVKMGLGIHAIRKENVKDKSIDQILNRICDNGLDIKKGSSVLATVSSLGISSELKYHQREAIKNYKLGSEVAENGVVVLVPTILEGNGEKLYVGFPGIDTSTVGNNHKTTCILDQLCCGNNDYGEFPKEFILGYFKKVNGERIFEKNQSHFLKMTDEERGEFIKGLSERLTEEQKQISEAVINGDMERLEQLSLQIYGNKDGALGDNTVVQNAMFYLRRNRDIEVEEINQDKDVKKDERKQKRKILLDSYHDLKLSDLTSAKEVLREGLNDQIKRYEGKEI